MTLLRKYPPMENCYYRVKLKNGRTIGPFRSGEWSLEPPEAGGGNPVPFLRFAHPVRPKGNIGLTPNEIDEVIVVCPRAIEVPDVELLEMPEIDLSNIEWPEINHPPEEPGETPQVKPCTNGTIREGFAGEEETDYRLIEVVEDSPAVEGAILSALEDYLPSLSHVKCWMYAIYQKTYTTTFWRSRCVNGEWIDLKPRIETEVETVRVRLHIGGVPCQDWRAFPPPRRLTGLSNNPSWGWIERRTFDSPR